MRSEWEENGNNWAKCEEISREMSSYKLSNLHRHCVLALKRQSFTHMSRDNSLLLNRLNAYRNKHGVCMCSVYLIVYVCIVLIRSITYCMVIKISFKFSTEMSSYKRPDYATLLENDWVVLFNNKIWNPI